MATHSTRLTQDQNFGLKTNMPIVQKNKGGRKALNDISNSGKPSALQPSRKHNKNNVIPISEDLGVSKKAQIPRKALADLTNSVSNASAQRIQGLTKKNQGKQSVSIAFTEDENLSFSIAEEGFLHNHDECIKLQKKSVSTDLDEFLRVIGLDACSQPECELSPRKPKDDINSFKIYDEIEEIPVQPMIEDRPCGGQISPICGSPDSDSEWLPLMDYDDFPTFVLIESPKR